MEILFMQVLPIALVFVVGFFCGYRLGMFKGAEKVIRPTKRAADGGLCLDCGHSVKIKRVSGCLNHPVRR